MTKRLSDITTVDGPMIYHGNARFTVISPVCVRLEYHPEQRFIDAPSLFAVNREAGWEGYTVEVNEKKPQKLVIDTGVMRLAYVANGVPLSSENLNVFFDLDGEEKFWDPKAQNLQNLGGTIASLDGQRGPVPLGEGLLSRDGWYLIDDSDAPLMVNDWIQPRAEDAGQDWYLFVYGRDFKAALRALTAVGGAVPLPRKYALGSWYSRWHSYTSDEYRELVDEYDQHNYPLDVLVWDMDWHRKDGKSGYGWANTLGWTGFSWNRDLLPDAETLIAELRDRGIAVTLNVHPHDGIREHEDQYEDFMHDIGEDPDTAPVPSFNAGDRTYMDAYFRHGHQPHEDAGVAFWWIDWQQDVLIPEVPGVPGLRHLPWLNELYFRQSLRDNRRGLILSRWAGWGDHRHPLYFSGDSITGWDMLAFEVPFTTTSGNVGCFFWSHDMGGFMGDIDDEIYARWLQFGAFSTAMRLHGLGTDRRPWTWAEWAQRSMHQSFELRSRLMPYTYTAVAQSCRESTPLCRAMYIEYPELESSYRNPQQYLYGDHFLAAPIASAGQGPGLVARQTVSFPAGRWFNWFTGERFDGPQERLVTADLYEMPLYVRGGIPIPMQPLRLRMTSAPLTELVIRCFPGPDGQTGTFNLYEDDGLSRDYENGHYAETGLTYQRNDNRVTVSVAPVSGAFDGMVECRTIRIELPCTEQANDVRVNGTAHTVDYDAKNRTNTVVVDECSVHEPLEITLDAPETDQQTIREETVRCRADSLVGENATPADIVDKVTAEYDAGNEQQAAHLAALLGVGICRKDESTQGNGTHCRTKLYAPSELFDEDRVTISVETGEKGTRQPVIENEYRNLTHLPVELPELPDCPRHDLTYRVKGTINGQALRFAVNGC